MELLPEGQQNKTQVSFEDQQNINAFSKLIMRRDRVETELKQLKQEKEYLDDVSLELELVDEEEAVHYKVGDVFLLLKQHEVIARLESDAALLDERVEKLDSQIQDIDEELGNLKKGLYAKFGNNINLER